MCLKPVGEGDIDTLFNEVERITDLDVNTGPTDVLSDKWIRAVIMKNLPEKIVTGLSIELRKAETVDDIQHLINTHMHDYRTGLPKGTPGPMICLTQNEEQDAKREEDKTDVAKKEDPLAVPDNIVNAVKGGKNGDGGQRKGYGQ